MEIQQRQLLFKLSLCKGISNLGKLKILEETHAQKRVNFTEAELIEFGKISTYKEIFLASWLSSPKSCVKRKDQSTMFCLVEPSYGPMCWRLNVLNLVMIEFKIFSRCRSPFVLLFHQ
jgi:hypothetical protein